MDELPHQEDTKAMIDQCSISTENSDGNRLAQDNEIDIQTNEPKKDNTTTTDGTWDCHKCKNNNGGHRKRCQGCLGWRGGVRENMTRLKKSSEDNTNMQIVQKEEYSFDKSGAVLPSPNEWEHEKYSTAQW